MKNCTKCNKQKSLDEFYRSKQSKDGRRWQCKACDYKSTIKSRKSKCPMCGNNKDIRSKTCEKCRVYSKCNWKGGKTTTANGYVYVYTPEHPNSNMRGYVMEHRLVMEDKLGRFLTQKENVHHINGIRDDNRLDNLELWVRSQPTGSRVEDKIEWCISFLKEYGYKVVK